MNIIVGHTNMDLDCIGSIVLAKYLFPGYLPLRSHLIHPMARNLLNLYDDWLAFATAAELKGQTVERIVVVDTRSTDRIAEYLHGVDSSSVEFEIFDHHPSDGRDIPGALIHEQTFGANTTQLGLRLMERGVAIAKEHATIALTGIYADTGNFTHQNVHPEDLRVAAYLLDQGASLPLVKDFLVPLREKQQILLFHEVLNHLEKRRIRGHEVQTCYLELEEDTLGLGAVVERVFEVENGELLFGFFYFKPKGRLLIIARNKSDQVKLNEIMAGLGGGGHRQAASATVKTEEGQELTMRILEYLERILAPAATAEDLMTETVTCAWDDMSLVEASMLLEDSGHTGVPVLDRGGSLVGLLTLRDIMVARKAHRMQAPVSTFMSRKIVTAAPGTTVQEVDELLFEHNIGHLPIVEGDRLVGIVTRGDVLNFKVGERRRKEALLSEVGLG